MNVQISPPPTRQDNRDDAPAHPARRYLIGGAALAVVLGGYWYFNRDAHKAPPRISSVPVRVQPVTQGTMGVVEHTIGTVLANSTVQINARVQGQLVKAFFKEGQMVKIGDPLFQIDPRPYQATYDNALASMASAKAKYERYARLKTQNAISPQDVDDAQALYLEAKATAESARLNLEYTSIHSPVNGKTGAILIQPGNMVAASTASTNATPLVTLTEIQPVKIAFSLPQSDLPRIQARQRSIGLTATISRAGSNDKLSAPVDFVSNTVNNLTGTIELRATFQNAALELVPGQLVDVTVELDSIPNAVIVPHDAVNEGPDGSYVYAIKDGRAALKPVTVQFDDTKNVAVTGALTPGEKVVVDGQLRLVPGTAVMAENRPRHNAGAAKSSSTTP